MSLILSWVVFPLALAAVGAGWGTLVEWASGAAVNDALIVPLGLAAALVVAGTFTAFASIAPAAVPVTAAGGVIGLLAAWPLRRRGARPWWRLSGWPLLAALGVLFVYGAPVILSGQATFLGFIKLDDTATWFDVIDRIMTHGRSFAGVMPSSYSLVFTGDVGPSYPLGAFVLPGVGQAITGIDIAWVFQPYLAYCGAAVAMCVYALMEPLISSPRLRAPLAFVAAQPALLYGYSQWGGIKELTAAFLLALGAALLAGVIPRAPRRPLQLLPLAVAAGALIQTLSVGAVGWVAPALVLVAALWLWQGWRLKELAAVPLRIALLIGFTAAFVLPVWAVLGDFLGHDSGLFTAGQSTAEKLGNLIHALSVFQLVGIWPIGDFRLTAPTVPSALLIGLALLAAAGALYASVRRGKLGLALYVAMALLGAAVLYAVGSTPWVIGKALAISSPALLAAALTGGGMLWAAGRRRGERAGLALSIGGVTVMLALAGGVLWSNALAYHEVTLAPRARLAELQHIGQLLNGHGPTFMNEYEVYADRHFLRAGAPVEPAEYRPVTLPLRNGTALTKSAWADLDSFPLSTLLPYPSIVTRRSPVESRPPSIYRLTWQGRYYQLWQRPAQPSVTILDHVPLGESNALPYCGMAEEGASQPLCSVNPVATPPCASVLSLGRRAQKEHARLVAYQRAAPIVARADQTVWPGGWYHDPEAHTLAPTSPGQVVAHIAVESSQRYELWLGGSFGRGFEVSVDGKPVGTVKDELSSFDSYVEVADLFLSAGVHTFVLTYPHGNLTPGSGESEYTSLSAIVLQPQRPRSEMLEVAPGRATGLCGRPLDWIELVRAS